MTAFSVRLPDDLKAELKEVARLGFECRMSAAAVACFKAGFPKVKKSLMRKTRTQSDNFGKQ
jgi:predicted transcriptional regulator